MVILSIRKTIEESAAAYFETAKKARRKIEGAKLTLKKFETTLPQAKAQSEITAKKKKEWYHSFRWSFTPDGSLIVAGRDASTNETIMKKHVLPTDIVFHTELPGSPFTLLRGVINDENLRITAQFCVVYSRAWKNGMSTADVFWVTPDQVSKTAQQGEYIGKGSFMIRGEKHFLKPQVCISLGVLDGHAAAGSSQLFESKNLAYATVVPGRDKTSDVSAKIVKKLGLASDDWSAIIPPGGCLITGFKKANSQIAFAQSEQSTIVKKDHEHSNSEETEE